MSTTATPLPKTSKTFARLTILDAGKMTREGRRKIAAWLQQQATALISQGTEYADVYIARWSAEVHPQEKEKV